MIPLMLLFSLVTVSSISFDDFQNKTLFRVKASPTQLWTGKYHSNTFFIKNVVKFSASSHPRVNGWGVSDTILVLNEIICSRIYGIFSVASIYHFLIVNEGDSGLPKYLLGSKKINHDPHVQEYRHVSLFSGFLVDVLLINDDLAKDDNVMYIPNEKIFIRSDVGGGGFFSGFGAPKDLFEKSVHGQISFMILNVPEWRDKHLNSAYLRSLRSSDFHIMWETFSKAKFFKKLKQVKLEMRILIENDFEPQDRETAMAFLSKFVSHLKSRYKEILHNKDAIKSEYVKSIYDYQKLNDMKNKLFVL